MLPKGTETDWHKLAEQEIEADIAKGEGSWSDPFDYSTGAQAPTDPDDREERAKKRRNALEYVWIQSDSCNTADIACNERMKRQRGGKTIKNKPSPRQIRRSLEDFIDWWRTNNRYMNGEIESK